MYKRQVKRVRNYKITRYSYRQKNKEGLEKFDTWLRSQTWAEVREAKNPSDMVAALHETIDKGMKQCFEHKTSTKKSSEPPWMSKELRDMIRRRRAVFKRDGRSENWWRLKLRSRNAIKERRDKYNSERREKIMGADKNNFYKCVNAFLNQVERWDIRMLYPDLNDQQIADEVAIFFNRIANEYPPLHDTRPLSLSMTRYLTLSLIHI